MLDQPIKVNIDHSSAASGIDDVNAQLLREASWQYNEIAVDVPNEFREANLKFLGGNWLEL